MVRALLSLLLMFGTYNVCSTAFAQSDQTATKQASACLRATERRDEVILQNICNWRLTIGVIVDGRREIYSLSPNSRRAGEKSSSTTQTIIKCEHGDCIDDIIVETFPDRMTVSAWIFDDNEGDKRFFKGGKAVYARSLNNNETVTLLQRTMVYMQPNMDLPHAWEAVRGQSISIIEAYRGGPMDGWVLTCH